MTIQNGKVVTFHYILKDDDGTIIDNSHDSVPLQYIHGDHYILPKLEEFLQGKSAGDSFKADLTASEGYGEYDKNLVIDVPRENFDTDMPIQVGMKFHAMTDVGPQVVTIKAVAQDSVTIDANHDLAGKNLHFDVEVIEVRDATEDERVNGLSYGCGGCGGCGNCEGDCSSGCEGGCCGGEGCGA